MSGRNASAELSGWEFQFNAGIVIMLNYIREADSVRMEGTTQDIEVFFNDGRTVFAQAKSCSNPDDNSNASRDWESAVTTLCEACQKAPVRELICVTNRHDPFCDKDSMRKFDHAYALVPFANLPQACKDKISKYCLRKGLSLPTDRFTVLDIEFSGDGFPRYETIKERVSSFLVEIDPLFSGWGSHVLQFWQQQFGMNASQKDRNIRISKRRMIWPLIVRLCDRVDVDWIDDFDGSSIEEIEGSFGSIIEAHSERFDLVSKIMTSYETYKTLHRNKTERETTAAFILEAQQGLSDEFDLRDVDPEIATAVRKLTIEKILMERRKIAKVKKAVGL